MFKSKRTYLLDLKKKGVKHFKVYYGGHTKVITEIFDVGDEYLFFAKGDLRIALDEITRIEWIHSTMHKKIF
jgi:hypothetical protein